MIRPVLHCFSVHAEQAKGEVDDASKKVQNQRQAAAPSNAQPLPPTIEPSYASPMPATPPNTQTQGAPLSTPFPPSRTHAKANHLKTIAQADRLLELLL